MSSPSAVADSVFETVEIEQPQDLGTERLQKVEEEYASLQAAHKALLDRIQNDQDHTSNGVSRDTEEELQTLRTRIQELETNVKQLTAERDELNSTVRDLRVRVEESRRAIMRLQGGPGAAAVGSSSLAPSSAAAAQDGLVVGNATQQRLDQRRSMAPNVLASWNPRELGNAGALGLASPLPDSQDSAFTMPLTPSTSNHSPEELAELKKSKRASLAFGPHAANNGAMRRVQGHRRILSGEGGSADTTAMPPPSARSSVISAAGGLREFHLAGAAVETPPSTVDRSSKRLSVISNGLFRPSPASDTVDLPPDSSPDRLASGSLLLPAKLIRRTSSSSSAVSYRDESDANSLAPPKGRLSHSSSMNSIASPIEEARDGDEEEEPKTARATAGLAAQQQTPAMQSYQMQRSLMESKARLRDRDDQIAQLKREMTAMRQQLDEAKDARDASEACLAALRNFVKEHDGSADGSTVNMDAFKGIKLPPLPTDKDAEDLEGSQDLVVRSPSYSAATPSGWRSLGNPFSGLAQRMTSDVDAAAVSPMTDRQPATMGDVDAAATSPAAQITNSFSSLWSRATTAKPDANTTPATGTAASTTGDSTTSDGASAAAESASDSRATSILSTQGADLTSPSLASTAAFKGFGWFNKRSTSSASESPALSTGSGATSDVRVSSPPFANLDNHVLTLDTVLATPTASANSAATASPKTAKVRQASFAASPSNGNVPATGADLEPNGRVKKAMEMSEQVDEDNGFVPPSF